MEIWFCDDACWVTIDLNARSTYTQAMIRVGKHNMNWVYWMFYDHLSAQSCTHSLLAKLGRWGWLMRMRLAWMKRQKTLDTSKILHQNKKPGVRAKDLIPNFSIMRNCELRESTGVSRLKAPSGWGGGGGVGVESRPGGAYNRVFNFGTPQTQGGGVQSFRPKQVNSLLWPWYNFLTMVPIVM